MVLIDWTHAISPLLFFLPLSIILSSSTFTLSLTLSPSLSFIQGFQGIAGEPGPDGPSGPPVSLESLKVYSNQTLKLLCSTNNHRTLIVDIAIINMHNDLADIPI